MSEAATARWADACAAAALLAGAPALGMVVRGGAGPVRDRFMALLRAGFPARMAWLRVPANVEAEALLGGVDFAATLAQRRHVMQPGLLARAAGGVIVIAMAERLSPAAAAIIAAAVDDGGFGIVALDEGEGDDEALAGALADRLAFRVALDGIALTLANPPETAPPCVVAPAPVPDAILEALLEAAAALGVAGLRAPLAAVKAAGVASALAGRAEAGEDEAKIAARLVLAPRARQFAPAEPDAAPPGPPPPAESEPAPDSATAPAAEIAALEERILAAAAAAIPPELVAMLARGAKGGVTAGRNGPPAKGRGKGRPRGVRPGMPRGGARLAIVESLRAAVPWQRLRPAPAFGRIAFRSADFRIRRMERPAATTTIFVVDASGSAAAGRLAEAKGAVESVLAGAYARRDAVALIAFRGSRAEVLLPPTRALARARRALAGLPGGGGTPLAAGLDAAATLAASIARRGDRPALLILTDGSANIARDGTPGRPAASADAMAAATVLAVARHPALVIDTAPRPRGAAAAIAAAMRAPCVALPQADSARLAAAARGLASRVHDGRAVDG